MWPRVSTLYLHSVVRCCSDMEFAVSAVRLMRNELGDVALQHVLDDKRHVRGQRQRDLARERRGAGEKVQVSAEE